MANLHKRHASAHAIGQRALSVFHDVIEDLHRAAHCHKQVADEAQAQINSLVELRGSADEAAAVNLEHAETVARLVGG